MIRIARPEGAPAVLDNAGEAETQRNCELYDANTQAYRSGAVKFSFERRIYAHTTVKDALLRAQHKKCCYCESKFRANSPGAVEHFRPKRAAKQAPGAAKHYPGYFWLAYRWDNLLVSCEVCNTSFKGSLFPILDDQTRARSHHDRIEAESGMFIDPAGEDPAHHIRFRRAEVEHLTERGLKTIHGLGLRRSELEDARAELLEPLEVLTTVIDELNEIVSASKVERARIVLNRSRQPEAEFSAMMRDFMSASGIGDEGD